MKHWGKNDDYYLLTDTQTQLVVQEFARFLNKHRCLEKFCYNYKVYHKLYLDKGLSARKKVEIILNDILSKVWCSFDSRSLSASLETSFPWEQSEEGGNYWFKLSELWQMHEVREVVKKITDKEKL